MERHVIEEEEEESPSKIVESLQKQQHQSNLTIELKYL